MTLLLTWLAFAVAMLLMSIKLLFGLSAPRRGCGEECRCMETATARPEEDMK